jgi:hypothetical protein
MWSYSAEEQKVVTPIVEMSRDTYRLSRAVFIARYFEEEMEDERRGGGKCRIRYFACRNGLASVSYTSVSNFWCDTVYILSLLCFYFF